MAMMSKCLQIFMFIPIDLGLVRGTSLQWAAVSGETHDCLRVAIEIDCPSPASDKGIYNQIRGSRKDVGLGNGEAAVMAWPAHS